MLIPQIAGSINFVRGDANSPLSKGTLTPLQGSITSLFAATAPEVHQNKNKYAGEYLMLFEVSSPDDESQEAKDPALASSLRVHGCDIFSVVGPNSFEIRMSFWGCRF
jgi:hypothetical protein